MLTVISGNNRNGYPCALNKVGDIFQHSTLPFETEGLTYFKSGNSQDASQKGAFPLAGLLSKIFFRVKVTTSGSAEVTVSMTSKDSADYANLSYSNLSSAKYRQLHSPMQEVTVTSRNAINGLASAHMVGVCADNLLNIKAESAFVQATGKEKGPRPALRVMQLLTCEEANELHHNSYLQATGSFTEWRRASQALGSMPRDCNSLRIIRFIHPARLSSPSCFCASSMAARSSGSKRNWKGGLPRLSFMCVDMSITPGVMCLCVMTRYYHMRQKTTKPGSATTLTGPLTTNDNTIIEVAMLNYTALSGRDKPRFTQTRPEFIDTYWVIHEYSTVPYGKVSFTRQDRRTFIAMFKDSRLIWAGRKPVQGIVEITTPQGMVNITTPLTIEKISTVPATITNIVTVQGVAHV